MAYQLRAHGSVIKDLARVPARIATIIRRVLDDFAANPQAPHHDLKRIQGHTSLPPTMRLRIGTYRVLLKVDAPNPVIVILRVGPRASVYPGLDHLDRGI